MIRVGGATEVEVKEKKDRVDDAMHATRAAVEEGIVPGGGVALLRSLKKPRQARAGERRPAGRHRHRSASRSAGSGETDRRERGRGRIDRRRQDHRVEGRQLGLQCRTEEYKDLVKAGIIDPTKVVRTALQDAASVAGLLITTEAMVAEKPKKDEPAMPGGMPGGGMGDMGF